MRSSTMLFAAALCCLLCLCPARDMLAEAEYREIEWGELIPPSWSPEQLFRDLKLDSLDDNDPRAEEAYRFFLETWAKAPANKAVEGQRITLPGFVVPLDWEGKELKEFLLVPYFGACIHMPPPPPNQIVHVIMREAVRDVQAMDTVRLYGVIHVEKRESEEFGGSGYTMTVDKVEKCQQ